MQQHASGSRWLLLMLAHFCVNLLHCRVATLGGAPSSLSPSSSACTWLVSAHAGRRRRRCPPTPTHSDTQARLPVARGALVHRLSPGHPGPLLLWACATTWRLRLDQPPIGLGGGWGGGPPVRPTSGALTWSLRPPGCGAVPCPRLRPNPHHDH